MKLRAKYDAAATTVDNQNHWKHADGLSADASLSPAIRQRLRNRSRYEYANNSYCRGILQSLATDVIGTGPHLGMQTGDKTTDSHIEWSFYDWTRAINWPQKLRLMRLAKARDGESFGRFTTNERLRHPVKLDLLVFEAEQIASPRFNVTDPRDGVITDDFGNVIGYSLLKEHPGAMLSVKLEAELVSARDMLHWANIERAGQHRGCPETVAALPLFAQLRRYTLATIAAAETAADIAGVIRTQQTPVSEEELGKIEPLDAIDIERRALLTLPKGWDISQLKAEQPTTTYAMFVRQIIAEVARCLNIPLNVALGDSSGFNYSSARLDWRNWQKTRQVERSQVEWQLADATLERWWEEARLVDGVLPEHMRDLPTPPQHQWSFDGDLHIDPAKEAKAQADRLASLTTTLADEYAREGKDWEMALRQIARERELMRELNLAAVTPSSEAPSSETPDEEKEESEDE